MALQETVMMERARRRDALPENQRWEDRGCMYRLGPCLECPLPACYEDDPSMRALARNWKYATQTKRPRHELSAESGLSTRTISRLRERLRVAAMVP
jgi:hypothetical protein